MELPKKLYKKINQPFIDFCMEYNITANQITAFNHVLTLTIGCFFLSRGTYWGWVLGLVVCLINGLLDYLDGDVAKARKEVSDFGVWLDSGTDVIIQIAVMGAIAIGCFKMGMPVIYVVLFFISHSAINYISFIYNARFGFESANGNELFRDGMVKKRSLINLWFLQIIDPTINHLTLSIYTYRYWIALGCVFNIMPKCFLIITLIASVRWIVMFILYSLYLKQYKYLHVLKVLALLDDEREEFYTIRSCG
jgi:phosphatidylglycerophosphate synthase